MHSTTWHRCWNKPWIWRMFDVRPDREVLVTVDLAQARLLAFELEWEDREGRRRYLAWSHKTGFDAGMVDLDEASAVAAVRISSTGPPDGEVLGAARRMVEAAGLGAPLGDWILSRLSA